MSQSQTTAITKTARNFRAVRSLHPTVVVPEYRLAEQAFLNIFGIESIQYADFESCQVIRDVFFATIVPELYLFDGFQCVATVDSPELGAFSWYVDDVPAAMEACRRHGLRLVNTRYEELVGDDLPKAGPYEFFCTAPDAAGLRYSIFEWAHVPLDARTHEGWKLPPVSANDPLGLVMSSHHTILTSQPARALKLVVDVLGGTVIHEGRDELIGASSTYVFLGDSVVEYAVPDAGTPARAAWARNIPNDTYYAITWQVEDLDRAEQHLTGQGVKVAGRAPGELITDPSTSMVPWGFTTALVPGDPRRQA